MNKAYALLTIAGLVVVALIPELLQARNKKNCCSGCCCGSKCCPQQEISTIKNNFTTMAQEEKEDIKKVYAQVANNTSCSFGGKSCGCRAKVSEDIGYTRKELDELADANLGLGCGNPILLGDIKEGITIIDLGSGAGLDCFLAARKVGQKGKVIGLDISEAMIKKASTNAIRYGYSNVEFKLGDIENMPIEDEVADIIISNCVLSLASDKEIAFKEAFRVLKPGGKMYVSDIVLLSSLTEEQKSDARLRGTCVLGAINKTSYLEKLARTGFEVAIIDEDTCINKTKYDNELLPISSLKYLAIKPKA